MREQITAQHHLIEYATEYAIIHMKLKIKQISYILSFRCCLADILTSRKTYKIQG